MSETIQQVTLYYRGNGSDKVYDVKLVAVDGGYLVNAFSGPRGATLTPRPQTPNGPVSLKDAEKVFRKAVDGKKHHRKTPYQEGPPLTLGYIPPERAASGDLQPQLLTAIDEPETANNILADSDYVALEKYDGVRAFLVCEPNGISGVSRTGKPVALTGDIESAAKQLSNRAGALILDGESMGETYYAFDILALNGEDMREYAFNERLRQLAALNLSGRGPIISARTAYTLATKQGFVDQLFRQGKEGVVLKRLTSPYLPGRQTDQFKYKFWSTASCLVQDLNGKHSLKVCVFDESNRIVPVGNVTIRNPLKPRPGDIIEVRYLNYREEGSLNQPVMLQIRNDLTANDCTLSQLHRKGAPRLTKCPTLSDD